MKQIGKWCILNVRSAKKAIYGFAALGQAAAACSADVGYKPDGLTLPTIASCPVPVTV